MEIVSEANKTVLAILGKPKCTDTKYRKTYFCVEKILDEGVLYNLLTKELLLLTVNEFEHFLEMDYLREHWFVVPDNTNDQETADLVRWVLTTRQKRSKAITSYTIFPTTDCNARCFYCFELGRSRIPMRKQTALHVVQYIKKHCDGKKVKITWFGGEPLYNQEAIDTICQGLSNEGVQYSSDMVTNAYLFDEEVIKKARDLWKLEWVQVTLDGTEAVYNRIKAYIYEHANPYQRVLNNIEQLLKVPVSVSIRMNMDLHNSENLQQLAEELAQRFKGKKNLCVYAHHLFKGNESMADIHTQEEWALREEAMCRIEECLKRNGLASKKGIAKRMPLYHCMADSDNAITILPDGNIGLCEHFSETEYAGHIESEGFDSKIINAWKETMPAIEECATCFYYPDCIMLKKCANGNKCFSVHRSGQLRKVLHQMENEFRKWQNKDSELLDDNGAFC